MDFSLAEIVQTSHLIFHCITKFEGFVKMLEQHMAALVRLVLSIISKNVLNDGCNN